MWKRKINFNGLIVLLLVMSFELTAQNQASVWYFGINAGLDFNSGTPISLSDGQLITAEGCSTISDASGQLLFYSDGITVWDKNHDVMPNGMNLLGDSSSTQSVLIVPHPYNFDAYYIFTLDKEAESSGLRYSEVDMDLNNGNGDVTSNKNILLETPTTEKISAVKHANGNDIWIISHGWNNNQFSAYSISFGGINTVPVISNVGQIHTGNVTESSGYMKFSPSGDKLALVKSTQDSFVEIFDFNNNTGVVSNPILIDGIFFPSTEPGPYGLEFSPNSELLYVTERSSVIEGSKIHQFDLSFNNASDIINSDVIIYDDPILHGALQLAIDKKIYITNIGESTLSVIENPDVLGVGCNFSTNAVNLNSGTGMFGLPSFIQSYFSVGINYENTCFGDATVFSIDTDENIISAEWNFGDGEFSSDIDTSHIYENSGDYLITLTLETEGGIRVFVRDITIHNIPTTSTITNFEVCDDIINDSQFEFDLTLKDAEILGGQSATEFSVNYFLSFADADNHQNILPDNYINSGADQEIFAKVYNTENYLCYAVATFELIVKEMPIANLVEDIITCDNAIIDGSQEIIFSNITPIVLGNQSEDTFQVSYHLNIDDATSGSNELPNTYNTISSVQEIFYRIENIESPECNDISSFNVIVDGQIIAYQPDNMYLCDEGDDGIEVFDLSSQDNQIIGNQLDVYNIDYYLSEIDALEANNALQNNYSNTENPQTIYARIERNNNPNCFDITSFEIYTLENPVLNIQETYYICHNEDLVLSVPTGFYSYLWSTNETTSSITVTEVGFYTVEVTQNYSTNPIVTCSTLKTIEVIESDEAIFESFEIEDWSDNNNTITVFVDGIGDYEYSLDNIIYQDSNVFNNLYSGDYNVFIRDKNGCGIITENIYLLFYPKFFTPNGDSQNPYWQIKLGNREPDMEISIYDRYGKFITKFNSNTLGWDGTLNGKDMPSNDYWFLAKRPSNGKTYTGHFALKR